jgi:hypothetical protein
VTQHYYPDPPLPINSLALASFILGSTSYFVLPVLGAIAAVITGHLARQEMRANPDSYSGEGYATAGLVLGYTHLALILVAIVFVLITLAVLPALVSWVMDIIN